jgi:hypothetical protein
MKARFFVISLILMTLTACGSGGSSGGGNQAGGTGPNSNNTTNPCETRSSFAQNWNNYICYDYRVNDCDTGKQEFQSIHDYCAGLKDDVLNKNCAHEQRMEDYNEACK